MTSCLGTNGKTEKCIPTNYISGGNFCCSGLQINHSKPNHGSTSFDGDRCCPCCAQILSSFLLKANSNVHPVCNFQLHCTSVLGSSKFKYRISSVNSFREYNSMQHTWCTLILIQCLHRYYALLGTMHFQYFLLQTRISNNWVSNYSLFYFYCLSNYIACLFV